MLFHTQPREQKCSWEQMLSPLGSTSQREEPIPCKMHPPGTKAAVGKVLPRETEALAGLDTPALLFKGLCMPKSAPMAFVLHQQDGKLPSLHIHQ